MTYLLSARPIWVYRLPGGGGFITAEVELSRREIKPSYRDGQIKVRHGWPSRQPFNTKAM